MTRWRCKDCNAECSDGTLLLAPNPFDSDDTIVGCPHCKCVSEFIELCDEPECHEAASCGSPTPDGYRRTCFRHSVFSKDKP